MSGSSAPRARRSSGSPRWVAGSLAGLLFAGVLPATLASPALAAEMGKVAGRSEQPLKAAFSNIGLQVSWCAQGKQAAEYWGKLYNVDVSWFDGELSATKQRAAIDAMAKQKRDFIAIQAFAIDTLTEPVEKMIKASTPVIARRPGPAAGGMPRRQRP